MFSLTNNELKVIQVLSTGDLTIKVIGERIGVSRRAASNLIHGLRDKKVVDYSGARSSKARLSGRSHADALRRFILEGTRPIESLTGGKLLVLLSIYQHAKTVERISRETGLKASSVERFLRDLSKYGLIHVEGGLYRLPPSDPIYPFLASYAKGSCQALMEDIAPKGVLIWYAGLEFIFTSDVPLDHRCVHITGLSAMNRYSLKFFTPRIEYRFSRWYSAPSAITVALDILLTKPTSKENVRYALLLLSKEHIDMSSFKAEAMNYGLDWAAEAISDFLSGLTVEEEWFPDKSDILQLFELYEAR